MKRNYLELWSILVVAFLLFFALSTCGDDIALGGIHIKTPQFQPLMPPIDSVEVAPAPASQPATQPQAQPVPQPVVQRTCLTDSALTLLLIGDSMIEGLSPRLGAYAQQAGYKLYSVIWYSSTTELYADTRLMDDYIRVLKPDFIFISLGGNELFINDIVKKRDKCVKEILAEVGDIPYLWIGPPNWKPDTGINQIIEDNVAEGCMFVSNGLELERKKDGAHPTADAAAMWMDTIIQWMPNHARYFMPMQQPQEASARPTRMYIHQPGKLTERPK